MSVNKAKISFGIRIDANLVEKLDEIVKESGYLNISRSEVVEAVLTAYFKSNTAHGEKARELVTLKRKGTL